VGGETVTVTCWRHRRRCMVLPIGRRGEGILIRHADEAWNGPLCDSEQFTVHRDYATGRDGAHAELLVLCLMAEHAKAAARGNMSPQTAAAGDDGGS
jgi:hypothetical protein